MTGVVAIIRWLTPNVSQIVYPNLYDLIVVANDTMPSTGTETMPTEQSRCLTTLRSGPGSSSECV